MTREGKSQRSQLEQRKKKPIQGSVLSPQHRSYVRCWPLDTPAAEELLRWDALLSILDFMDVIGAWLAAVQPVSTTFWTGYLSVMPNLFRGNDFLTVISAEWTSRELQDAVTQPTVIVQCCPVLQKVMHRWQIGLLRGFPITVKVFANVPAVSQSTTVCRWLHSLLYTNFIQSHEFLSQPHHTLWLVLQKTRWGLLPPSYCKWMKQMMCFSKKVKITFFLTTWFAHPTNLLQERAKVLLSCKKNFWLVSALHSKCRINRDLHLDWAKSNPLLPLFIWVAFFMF